MAPELFGRARWMERAREGMDLTTGHGRTPNAQFLGVRPDGVAHLPTLLAACGAGAFLSVSASIQMAPEWG